MPTDDKKKKAALKRALDKAPATGKMQKTKQPIMRANKTIKNIPRLVLKRSVRYGKDKVKDPKVAARNDDQERGANLKKVKVKVKAASTKKASPVKAGKYGADNSSKEPTTKRESTRKRTVTKPNDGKNRKVTTITKTRETPKKKVEVTKQRKRETGQYHPLDYKKTVRRKVTKK